MKSRLLGCLLAGGILIVSDGRGQVASQPSAQNSGKLNVAQLPPELQTIATALGDRLQTPGKERVTITGTLTESGNTSTVTVTYQLPNSFRCDRGGAKSRSVSFDGNDNSASDGNLTEQDEDLMESFLEDAPETMLYSLLHGTSLRVLTRRARMDDGTKPNYLGPWAAIYQLVGGAKSRSNQILRQKHYYFDSVTHLPTLVRYRIKQSKGSLTAVETSRTDWIKAGGQQIPGTISRSEDGKNVFVFHATSVSLSPGADDGFFSKK